MENLYTKEEIQEIIKEKFIVVMDTNVWLDLYYLPFDKIKSIVEGIDKSDFFYMPHQIFKEILNNNTRIRNNIENEYRNSFKPSINKLKESKTALKDAMKKYEEKNIEGINELYSKIEVDLDSMISNIEKSIKDFKDKNRTTNNCVTSNNDIIEKLVKKLLGKNDFDDFETLELLKIYEEGELRYKYNIPPGITDEGKNDEETRKTDSLLIRKYGDLIIWKEVLRYIENNKTNVILVQNEKKEDWWDSSNLKGKKISNVLIEEFNKYSQKRNASFLMMRFEEFFNHFSEELIGNLEYGHQIDALLRKKEEAFRDLDNNLSEILAEVYFTDVSDLISNSGIVDDVYMYMHTSEGEIDEVESVYLLDIEVSEMSYTFIPGTNNRKYRALIVSESNINASTTVGELYYRGTIRSLISFWITFVVEDNTNLEKDIRDCLDLLSFELEDIEFIDTLDMNFDLGGHVSDLWDDIDEDGIDEDIYGNQEETDEEDN